MSRNIRGVAMILAVVATLASSCSGDSGELAPLQAELGVILSAASDAMGEVDTVAFSIRRAGAPIYIDPADLLEFRSAEGHFAGPSSADAVVTITVGGLDTRIGAVAIEGQMWLSNPVTGAWEPAPSSFAFDPATLFDPQLGWRPLLASGLDDGELVGTEDTAGAVAYHVRAIAAATRVEVMTAGLVRDQNVLVDLWLDQVTGRVLRAEFPTEADGATSQWTLSFNGYGTEVSIDPPDLASGG